MLIQTSVSSVNCICWLEHVCSYWFTFIQIQIQIYTKPDFSSFFPTNPCFMVNSKHFMILSVKSTKIKKLIRHCQHRQHCHVTSFLVFIYSFVCLLLFIYILFIYLYNYFCSALVLPGIFPVLLLLKISLVVLIKFVKKIFWVPWWEGFWLPPIRDALTQELPVRGHRSLRTIFYQLVFATLRYVNSPSRQQVSMGH